MASLPPASVYSGKEAMGRPTLPFTTIQDDPDIGSAPQLPEQLVVPVQTGAGHYEDEHVCVSVIRSFEDIGLATFAAKERLRS